MHGLSMCSFACVRENLSSDDAPRSSLHAQAFFKDKLGTKKRWPMAVVLGAYTDWPGLEKIDRWAKLGQVGMDPFEPQDVSGWRLAPPPCILSPCSPNATRSQTLAIADNSLARQPFKRMDRWPAESSQRPARWCHLSSGENQRLRRD